MENEYENLRLKIALLNLMLAYDQKSLEDPNYTELDAVHTAINMIYSSVGGQSQAFLDEMRLKYDRRKFKREE